MIHPRWAAVLLALLTASCSLAAAANHGPRTTQSRTPITEFVHDAWRSSEGLPQNSVQAIIQTHDGYLWLGTQEGLVRFDGVTFTVFNRQNTPGLRLNDIRALVEDRSGALWIGIFGGGLSRMKDGKFTSYSAQEGLSNSFVSSLCVDRKGSLWVGTQGGINRRKDGKFTVYTRSDGLVDDFVSSLWEDHAGTLWVGTGGGLSRWADGKFATYKIAGLGRTAVESIHEDSHGNLWIGTDHELVRLRDGASTVFAEKDGIPRGPVTSISEDHAGNLWLGTSGAGVMRLHGGRFSYFGSREGLTNTSILSIYQDREGSIWIGTNGGGLNRLRLGAFKTYDEAAGISSGSVMSVLQTRDGSLWVGTDGGGLDHFKDGTVTVYGSRDGLSNQTIRSIYEDSDGSLWLGTDGGGVNRFRNGHFRVYSTRDGLSNDNVRSVSGDREGNIWIGTYGGGLNRLHHGKFSTYTTKDGLPSDTVWLTHEDRSNNLWVGTNEGLALFKDGRFHKLADLAKSEAPRAPSPVLSIYEDPKGVLWIGTLRGGLLRFQDGKFTTYTIADGLFDDLIYTILEDASGSLWMSSNRGIFRVRKSELEDFATGKTRSVTSVSYGVADGMKNPECNGGAQPAGWKTSDGKLLFANISGLVEVDPDKIRINPLPPPVVIQRAVINQKPYDPGAAVEVPPGKGELQFEYTAMSFLAPQRMGFQYRLEGFDSQWIDAGTRRTAYYTNIPPGSYRFRVIASNNDGIWNDVGAALGVTLRAHFYQSYGFYGLIAALLAFGFYAVHRVRVSSLRARERKLRFLVDQRTQELQQDIAQRKKTEVALQESQDYFQAFMNNSPAVATLRDQQGRYVYVNRTFQNLFRTAAEDYSGKTAFDWLPHETASQLSENNALVLNTGKAAEFIETVPAGDGTPHEWLSVKFPVKDARGQDLVGSVSIDITERRRAEAILEQRTAYLNALIENSPLAIVVGDSGNKIEFCNSAFEKLFQYRREDIIGRDIDELITPPDEAIGEDESSRLPAGGQLRQVTGRRRRKNGTLVDVEIYCVPLRVGDQVVGAYGLYLDITERKWAEQELRRAKEAAESGSRAKSEFLANMSHEIRTPMNGVMGMTELALGTELTGQQREYLEIVQNSAESLLNILNDVLDFSKIEAGKLDLDERDFDLEKLFGETMKALAVRAHEKNLELAYGISGGVPQVLFGDSCRLRQILTNLVSNAIKFTESGEVVVNVELERRAEDCVTLHTTVSDTGVGIPEDRQKFIFDAFCQADSSTTRRYGGTGLGLTISARLVHMMKGCIWVESSPGKGSTFHFTASFKPGAQLETVVPANLEHLAALRVLVVDDSAASRKILADMLRSWGASPVLAQNGGDALLELDSAYQRNQPFQIVLIDGQMSGMDGFELAARIRQDPHWHGVNILMLTSCGEYEDKEKCRRLGVSGFVAKPVRRSELLDPLLDVTGLGKETSTGKASLPTDPGSGSHPLRILVAEDNAVNQQLAMRLLQNMGHDPRLAKDGREAVAEYRKGRFDLVLMDVQMPEVDGFQATKEIRTLEKESGIHTPIVAMTAHAMKGDRERCEAAGMDDYLSKPVKIDELRRVLDAWGRRPLSPPTVALNKDEVLAGVDGDRELLAILVDTFIEDAGPMCSEIITAAQAHDAQALGFVAHRLKGAALFFGNNAVSHASLKLESMSRSNDLRDVHPAVLELQSALDGLIPGLLRLKDSLQENATF